MSELPHNKRPDVLIGGGAGVALVLLAEKFTDPNVKQFLLYAAPFASMIVGSGITWLRNFGLREIRIKHKQWDLGRVKKHLAQLLEDPGHPDSFKQDALKRVRNLEMQILTLMMEDLEEKSGKRERDTSS